MVQASLLFALLILAFAGAAWMWAQNFCYCIYLYTPIGIQTGQSDELRIAKIRQFRHVKRYLDGQTMCNEPVLIESLFATRNAAASRVANWERVCKSGARAA